ncbi:Wzz/FepE/Etk N-terminal domain-containing protein [Pedobacter sp. Leaf194]|uniref:Wzz/FepE/Etk N-terminal domain-containing protein n=1 Tax=Pedobacter sp. Leaf194 TaxID=1736297 RepID=UPI0007033054|nr:Wzz/FepE/Etk N-terminal domain-containing protein [Pedobacter sp. Leaf194]KQS37810.1 hypothetical protein ASG14_19860 [Pedobacter sp. Leaf194]
MQSVENNVKYTTVEEEFSFASMINARKKDLKYLWKHKIRILIIGLIGGAAGIALAYFWPVTYTAKLTFVVEEGKSSGGGLLSSLAGQMGFDIGGLTGGTSGVLAGDNVLQLLTSQKMVKQTILTPLDSNGTYTLADKYADAYKLKEDWKDLKVNTKKETVMFPADTKKYTRLQDSLLQSIIIKLTEKELSVSKPDKKLGFFALTTTMKNEQLASLVCTRLIEEATLFYIQTKTKRLRINVDRLQTRADSIGRLLNRKTYAAAGANAIMLDANPAYATIGVGAELQERDKRVLQTIYSEIIKNLEVSRSMLMQETPTFQIVDEPEMPLKKNRMRYSTGILIGGLLFGAFYCLFLLIRRKD